MKYFMAAVLLLGWTAAAEAKTPEVYLYYNVNSPHLEELSVTRDEVLKVFDDNFGPAAEELPQEVKLEDYYVSRYPDGDYVFILKAPFSCGRLGCAAEKYNRDADGDLYYLDSTVPVLCEKYEADKLLCRKGGYKPPRPKKSAPAGKKIIHYYPPKSAVQD